MIGNPRETRECLHKTLVSTRVCAGECGSPEERAFVAYCHYRPPIDVGGQHGQALRWANLQIVPVVFDGSWQARRN